MTHQKNFPTKTELAIASWMETASALVLLGKKILCCPPSERPELMSRVLEAANQAPRRES